MGDGYAFGLAFHGTRILQAVLKDLVAKGLAGSGGQKHTVILSGQSAGGRGAMVNLDYIQEMVTAAGGTAEIEVVGFLDSALWMDIPNHWSSGNTDLGQMTSGVFGATNPQHLGPDCAAAYPGSDGWKCLFAQYRMPFVKTPYFAVMSAHDSYQLGNRVGGWPDTDDKISYTLSYGSEIKFFMRTLRANWPANATRQNAIYSRSCWEHACSTADDCYNKKNVRGITQKYAFHIFLGLAPQTDPSSPNVWMEDCDGVSCGGGCDFPY